MFSEEIDNSKITDDVMKSFAKHVYFDRKHLKTKADGIIHFISLIYDINFKYGFEILKKENYINIILNKFTFKDKTTSKQMRHVLEIATQYIENNL